MSASVADRLQEVEETVSQFRKLERHHDKVALLSEKVELWLSEGKGPEEDALPWAAFGIGRLNEEYGNFLLRQPDADLAEEDAALERTLIYKTFEVAAFHYDIAAQAFDDGHMTPARADYALGSLYDRDLLPTDEEITHFECAFWHKLDATKGGLAVAMIDVADCYRRGLGVEQSCTTAYEWALRASLASGQLDEKQKIALTDAMTEIEDELASRMSDIGAMLQDCLRPGGSKKGPDSAAGEPRPA